MMMTQLFKNMTPELYKLMYERELFESFLKVRTELMTIRLSKMWMVFTNGTLWSQDYRASKQAAQQKHYVGLPIQTNIQRETGLR